MPKQASVAVGDSWVQLTDADVSTVTFQNIGGSHIRVMASVGAVVPTSEDGALRYNAGQGEMNASLADLFPGVSGANRLWARAADPTSVVVSHA